MEDKINRIFDKLENADVSPSANYSMPEYYMHCAMQGREREKRTLFNWISMSTGMDVDLINTVFNERYNNVQNESRNMRRTIRLRENELRRMIAESVRRVINEMDTNSDKCVSDKEYALKYGEDPDYPDSNSVFHPNFIDIAMKYKANPNKYDSHNADYLMWKYNQNKKEQMKNQRIKDNRWQKAADSRQLHRKGSLNRAMDESVNRIVSECLKRNLR